MYTLFFMYRKRKFHIKSIILYNVTKRLNWHMHNSLSYSCILIQHCSCLTKHSWSASFIPRQVKRVWRDRCPLAPLRPGTGSLGSITATHREPRPVPAPTSTAAAVGLLGWVGSSCTWWRMGLEICGKGGGRGHTPMGGWSHKVVGDCWELRDRCFFIITHMLCTVMLHVHV